MRDDPVYLCGLYEAKLDALRAVLQGNNLYLGGDQVRLMRAILGLSTNPILDEAPAPRPRPEMTEAPV